jgi:hypothetical protein
MERGAAAQVSWSADYPLFALTLMGDAQRLNSLDDLWTSLLAVPGIESELESYVPMLQSMVGEMVGSLTSVVARTEQLERLTEHTLASGIDLDTQLADILGHADVPADVGPSRPFANAVHEACRVLREEAPREIADITVKLLRISEGRYEPGDWGRRVKRALLIVAAAAGVLAAISIPGALVIPVALSAGAGVVAVVSSALVAWDSLPAD